jgi:hypothetical protein
VACLALQLAVAERPARVTWDCVLATKQREGFRIVVTSEAGIGAVPAILRIRLCLRYERRQQTEQREPGEPKIPVLIHLEAPA